MDSKFLQVLHGGGWQAEIYQGHPFSCCGNSGAGLFWSPETKRLAVILHEFIHHRPRLWVLWSHRRRPDFVLDGAESVNVSDKEWPIYWMARRRYWVRGRGRPRPMKRGDPPSTLLPGGPAPVPQLGSPMAAAVLD